MLFSLDIEIYHDIHFSWFSQGPGLMQQTLEYIATYAKYVQQTIIMAAVEEAECVHYNRILTCLHTW